MDLDIDINKDTIKENFLEKFGKPSKELKIKLGSCAFLALFWVIFIWNFWDKGIYALGINNSVFLLLFLALLVWVLIERGNFVKADFAWIVPIGLIALSHALFENTFLKTTSFFVLAIGTAIFYNQAFLEDKKTRYWDVLLLLNVIQRTVLILGKIGKSVSGYLNILIPAGVKSKQNIAKVIIGVSIFFVVAVTVFIPLLSSADPVFSDKIDFLIEWATNLVSDILVTKILTFFALAIFFASMVLAWGRKFEYKEKETTDKKVDPIVSSIVLGGILILYLLFLWIQVNRLWVGNLPFDFKETESLVKSGFWQLFLLSVINIFIYFFTYRKTHPVTEKFLLAFTGASLLLLVSAGYRMGLYIVYYGFSYEKFFAAYTVIYCAILFVWLISRLFIKRRSNILKFLIVLFIWMYAMVSIFPVEQFILKSNVSLSKRPDSRIRLFELTMLSPDVLSMVKNYQEQGLLEESVGYLAREGEEKSDEKFNWNPWIETREKQVNKKQWYELNLMNIIYLNKN